MLRGGHDIIFVFVGLLLIVQIPAELVPYKGLPGKYILPLPKCFEESEVRKFGWYDKPSIVTNFSFDTHDWNSSIISGYLGAYLLKEVMNKRNTMVIQSNISIAAPFNASYNPYSSTANKVTTFNLEVWDISGEFRKSFASAASQKLVSAKESALIGLSGVYMSNSLKTAFPAKTFNDYTILNDAAVLASLPAYNDLATEKVNGKFVCNSEVLDWCDPVTGMFISKACSSDITQCRQLWSTYPTHDIGFLPQMINNNNIKLVIVYLGTSFMDLVGDALNKGKHLIVYNWDPSEFTALYATLIFRLSFPTPTVECIQGDTSHPSGPLACDFESKRLLKVFDYKLEEFQPPVYELINNIVLDNFLISDMLRDINKLKEPASAACSWLKKNKAIWENWVPIYNESTVQYTAPIITQLYLPSNTTRSFGNAFLKGFELGLERFEVSKNISVTNSALNDLAVYYFGASHFISNANARHPVAVVGPSLSSVALTMASLTSASNIPHIAGPVTSSSLRDKEFYPSLVRPGPDSMARLKTSISFSQKMKWWHVTAIVTEDDALSGLVTAIHAFRGSIKVDVVTLRANDNRLLIRNTLIQVKTRYPSRIIFVNVEEIEEYILILEEARSLKMIGNGISDYVFITYDDWYYELGQEYLNQNLDILHGLFTVTPGPQNNAEFKKYENLVEQLSDKSVFLLATNTGLEGEPTIFETTAMTGYDTANILMRAVNNTYKDMAAQGLEPTCLQHGAELTTSPLCYLPSALVDDIFDRANCSGIYESQSCIKTQGILTIINAKGRSSIHVSELLLLDQISKTEVEGILTNISLSGQGELLKTRMIVRNGQAVKNSTGQMNLVFRTIGSCELFEYETTPPPFRITQQMHFPGSTFERAILESPPYIAPVSPSCSREAENQEPWIFLLFDGDPRGNASAESIVLAFTCALVVFVFVIDWYVINRILTHFEVHVVRRSKIRHNLANYVSLAIIGMEHFQIVRICFKSDLGWLSKDRQTFKVLQYLSLALESEISYIICLAAACLWTAYSCLIYYGVDSTLEKTKVGAILMKPAIPLLVALSTGLYFPLVETILGVNSCAYIKEFDGIYMTSVCKLECFNDNYWRLFSFSYICLFTFIPGSFLLGHIWQELEEDNDIKFTGIYILVYKNYKTALILSTLHFGSNPIANLVFVALLSSLMLIWLARTNQSYIDWANIYTRTLPCTGVITAVILILFEAFSVKEQIYPMGTVLFSYCVLTAVTVKQTKKYTLFSLEYTAANKKHSLEIEKIRLFSGVQWMGLRRIQRNPSTSLDILFGFYNGTKRQGLRYQLYLNSYQKIFSPRKSQVEDLSSSHEDIYSSEHAHDVCKIALLSLKDEPLNSRRLALSVNYLSKMADNRNTFLQLLSYLATLLEESEEKQVAILIQFFSCLMLSTKNFSNWSKVSCSTPSDGSFEITSLKDYLLANYKSIGPRKTKGNSNVVGEESAEIGGGGPHSEIELADGDDISTDSEIRR